MAGNTHVPDKLHAFTLQVRHMMYELISVDLNKVVSVEALDDVAVESENEVIAEQIKSVQSNNNPLTDRSDVFWKTLYNWWQYVQNGSLNIKSTTFQFVIISNHTIAAGSLPKSFAQADSIEKAKSALQKAKILLWGPNEELKDKIPDGYSKYLEVLFDKSNAPIVEQIIQSFKMEIYDSEYDDNLFKKFCGQPIPLEYSDSLFIFMLGWIHERVNAQTKNGEPAYIRCKDFRDTLVTQTRLYNQNVTLSWATMRPTSDETRHEFEKQDTYIRQLDFIELDMSDKLQAASDFLRTSVEKTNLALRGIVAPQSFDDYYDSLFNMWNNQRRLVMLSPLPTDIQNGKKVYFICQESARAIKMQGMDTPESFGAGSLHAMANEPQQEPQIGWHPTYKKILNAGEGKNEEN